MTLDPAFPDGWPDRTGSPVPTPYEAEALTFCRAWLGGQTRFTLHTSGSTGVPKPIVLTRTQMRASAHLTAKTLGLRAGDAALVCLNIRYVAGVMMLVRGLEISLPLTLVEPAGNPLARFDATTTRFAFAAFVPLQLQTILADAGAPDRSDKLPLLNGMKAILVGGAATSAALEAALQRITAPVYATYGMTETVSHIALRRLNGPDKQDVFTALAGVSLGTDERGCLHITSAATNHQRVQTNDVVDLLDSAHFRVLGRADTIINSGGVKVQPEAIERVIQGILAPADPTDSGTAPRLFVAGLPDERLGQRLVLFLENEELNPAQWLQIQDRLREQMGTYAVPKDVRITGPFAETPTGKIDRRQTLVRYAPDA